MTTDTGSGKKLLLNFNALKNFTFFGISRFNAGCFLFKLISAIKSFSKWVPIIEIECLFSEQGNEKAVPIDPAPKINMLAIIYSLKINFLIKNKIAIISILPITIKIINEILVSLFKSKKLKLSNPYNDDVTVFVRVSMDNLKEFSKVKLSKVKILDKKNREIMKEMKIKKAIFESSSLILNSVLNKFLLIILIGFTSL